MAKSIVKTMTVGDAISSAYSVVEELAGEMREWYDNMPANLQGGSKGSEVSEIADALEDVSEPDVPACAADLPVTVTEPVTSKKQSRANRMSIAVRYAEAVVEVLEDLDEEGDDWSDDDKQAIEACVQEVQAMVDEIQDVNFPSAF